MDDPSLPETYVEGFHDLEAVRRMQYNVLGNTGLRVSCMGLGTAANGGCYLPSTDEESIRVIRTAVKNGVNYLDTSPWYGHSEEVLGKALEGIPRQAYYLATKVGHYFNPDIRKTMDFSAERVVRSVDQSLNKLGVSYLDVVQLHDFEYAFDPNVIEHETLPALLKVKESGKTRFIGIAAYPLELIKGLLERSAVPIDLILNFGRACLLNEDLADYHSYLQERNLGIVNGSPLALGLLTPAAPPSWHPASPDVIEAARNASDLCIERGLHLPRLAMHYALNRPYVHTTLCSTEKVDILLENLQLVGHQLSPEEENCTDEIKSRIFGVLPQTSFGTRLVEQRRRAMEEAESSSQSNTFFKTT